MFQNRRLEIPSTETRLLNVAEEEISGSFRVAAEVVPVVRNPRSFVDNLTLLSFSKTVTRPMAGIMGVFALILPVARPTTCEPTTLPE